jgi:sulfite reductase (NADPH) flavoprotein alpha-component
VTQPSTQKTSQYTRTNPFPGKLLVNRTLCGQGSSKDTRHFEIDLTGSGLSYEVGDSMTIWPTNDHILVDEIIKTIGANGSDPVQKSKPGNNICVRPCSATVESRRPLRSF